MENSKKHILICGIVFCALMVLLTVAYAFINVQLMGTKKQVLTAGSLSLKLDEDENNLSITDAMPMYDEVGMIQEAFTFRLINNTSLDTNYILKLVDITTGDKLDTSIVKYGLTKDGVSTIDLLSNLTDGEIDTGTITGNTTIEYSLRLWISSTVTDNDVISGKSLKYRLNMEAKQENGNDALCNYDKEDYELQIQQLEDRYATLNNELANNRKLIADALLQTGVSNISEELNLTGLSTFVKNSLTYFSGSVQIYPSEMDPYNLVNGWTGTANTGLYSNRAISLTNLNTVTFEVKACGKCSNNCENRWTNTITSEILSSSGEVLFSETKTSPDSDRCSSWSIEADVSSIKDACTFKFYRGGSNRADVSVISVTIS